MKTIKFYKILSILLLLLNLGTVAFFWFNRPQHGPPNPGDLAEKLGIVEGLDEVIALETKHHKVKRALMAKDRKMHNLLFTKIGSGEDVSELREKITSNYIEIETMTYNFFDSIAAYCNDKQLKELKSSVDRAFRQLRKPPGGKTKQ